MEAAAERQSRIEVERKRREECAAKVAAADSAERLTCNDSNTTTKLKCNTCKETFQNTISHREHFRSDYHRENLRRKTRGELPLTITEW